MSETSLLTGKVKWFNAEKGYGFIEAEGLGKDVFLHVKNLRQSGISQNLVEGEHIKFLCNDGPRGLFATQISRANAS